MSAAPFSIAPGEPPRDRPLASLAKHSAIYSAAPLLRQFISIGMTRLYTAPDWLGQSGYGIKEIVDLWLIALQQLLGQNVLSAMVRFYFDQKDPRERAGVVSSCVLLITSTALVLCGAALFFVPQLTLLMFSRGEAATGGVTADELARLCTILLVLVPFQLGTISGFYYLQTLKRSGLYTAIQTAKLLFEIGFNFYLIGHLQLGVRGFLLSMLAGEILTSVSLCSWILWTLRPRLDWRLLRPILWYAAPLIPVGMLQLALHSMDRRLLLEFGPEGTAQAMTGVYGLGYRISYLVTNMVLGPFIQIWQPWIFGIEEASERARLVARVGTYAVLTVAVVSLGVILFGRQAAVVLAKDPAFWDAYQVIPFVAAGYVFWALYNVSQTPLFLAKRTGRLLVVNLLAVVLNYGLNSWLIPAHGIVGAAVATLVSFAVLAGMGVLASRSAAGVTFEHGRLAGILLCVTVGGTVALWMDHMEATGRCSLWFALVSKAAALMALIAVLWCAVLRVEERTRFRSWIGALAGGGRAARSQVS